MRCVNLALLCFAAACASRAPTQTPIVAPAATPGPAVALPCGWPVGTTAHYSYERRQQDSRAPGLEQVATISPATLTVLGPDRLSLDIGLTEVTGPPHLLSPPWVTLSGFDPLPMELVLQDAVLVDVANAEELVPDLVRTARATLHPDSPPAVLASLTAAYEDPANRTRLLLKEPNLLLGALCMVMDDGERIEDVTWVSGLSGGSKMRTISIIEADIRQDEGTATYTFTNLSDPESVRRAVEEHLKTVNSAAGERSQIVPVAENQSVTIVVHSLADGLPVSVEATQTILVHVGLLQVRREERWLWTRLPAP
jgi:hypothetical protein